MPQAVSVAAAITTETAHIMASWNSAGRDGSTNCGRKAVKKAMVFGFESATRKPRQKCTRPGGAAILASRPVAITALNDAPVAQAGAASGNEDTTIFGNAVATDVDNTAAQLTYSLVGANGGATHGTVSLNPDGSFTYAPAAEFSGGDSFSFKANDGALDSNTASIAITVAPVNDAPVLGGDDAITVPEGGTVAVTTADLTATRRRQQRCRARLHGDGRVARHRAEERRRDDELHASRPRREPRLLPARRQRARRQLHGLAHRRRQHRRRA